MTPDHVCSGRCAMSADQRLRLLLGLVLLGLLLFGRGQGATAAEAPVPPPDPVPVEAEAPHQDLKAHERKDLWLDEAVFTEISPLTIPEQGVRLPEDQEH